MKSFKNMLMIIAIFAVASINAKQMGVNRTTASRSGKGQVAPSGQVAHFEKQIDNLDAQIKNILNSVDNLIRTVNQSKLSNPEKDRVFRHGKAMIINLDVPCDQARQKFTTAHQALPQEIEEEQEQIIEEENLPQGYTDKY